MPVHKNTLNAIRLGEDDEHEDDSCDDNDDGDDNDDDEEQVMTGGTGLSCAHPDSII